MSFFFNNNYSTIFGGLRFYIPPLTYAEMLLIEMVALYIKSEPRHISKALLRDKENEKESNLNGSLFFFHDALIALMKKYTVFIRTIPAVLDL